MALAMIMQPEDQIKVREMLCYINPDTVLVTMVTKQTCLPLLFLVKFISSTLKES